MILICKYWLSGKWLTNVCGKRTIILRSLCVTEPYVNHTMLNSYDKHMLYFLWFSCVTFSAVYLWLNLHTIKWTLNNIIISITIKYNSIKELCITTWCIWDYKYMGNFLIFFIFNNTVSQDRNKETKSIKENFKN